MTEENRFACDTCTSLCEAQKRVHMSHAPDNILLALKRFAIEPVKRRGTKIMTPIRIPTRLSLPTTDGTSYTLRAVTSHSAPSIQPLPMTTIQKVSRPILAVFFI